MVRPIGSVLSPHFRASLRVALKRSSVQFLPAMPVYQYETIPSVPDEAVRRFEVKQSMNDKPLSRDPDSGKPVRRVISGGFLMLKADAASGCESGACDVPPPQSCGGSCACHP